MKTQYFFEINGKISSCFSCPFHFSDGDIHCVLKKSIICLTYEKPSKCPLVELPPHGELISKQETVKKLMNTMCKGCKHTDDCGWCAMAEYRRIVEDTPTILEASKEN